MSYSNKNYRSIQKNKINLRRLFIYSKQLLIVAVLFSFAGCIGKSNLEINQKNLKKTSTESLNITVSNVQVINHQIVITGTNLLAVNNFNIKEGSNTTNLEIESQTSTSIVANTLENVSFAAGKVFDFVFSNAMANSTFTVDFSLCSSSLGGKAFDCLTAPLDKQVLSYDQASGKWKPRDVNGLNYIGAYDSSSGATPAIKPAGQYYIVSVAGDINAGAVILGVGDWIVSNGTLWQKIDNSTVITSVFGRTGAVTASLSDLTDIDFGVNPTANQYLKFNGTDWAPATLTYTETDPTVSAFAKAVLPTCTAGQVLKGDGTTLTCVTDNAGASFTGTANRAVVTDGSGLLAVSAITDTVLGYLSGATSNIQTQINAKVNTSSFVDWSTPGLAPVIDPTRINLITANRVVVTNGSANVAASSVTTTELGYLTGVTSSVQTQLNSKLSSFTETDPGVSAFAKVALPSCDPGEVLKADGTTLSCVTDGGGAGGVYTGTMNRLVLTDGATGALTVSTVTNVEAGYLSGVTSAIQTQLTAKQATITAASTLTTGSIQTNLQNAVAINPFNTAAGNTGEFRFYELAANGVNYTGFKSPDLLGANIIYTMPATAPNAGEVLSSTAAGVLSWTVIPSSAVTTVFGRNGVVVAANGDYTASAVTNVAAGNIAGTTVQAAINELDTEKQSIASFAADVRAVTLSGLSIATSGLIATGDTILAALGNLQAQISAHSSSIGNKADTNNGSQSITAANINTTTINGGIIPDLSKAVVNEGGVTALQTGTLAAMPVAAPANAGRVYLVKDSGNEAVYISSGTIWVKIAQSAASGTTTIPNGGTGATTFTANKIVVVNGGATALVDGPSLDDTTAVAATVVKRGPSGEVYGQNIIPTSTVTETASCTTLGAMAKDSNGNILSCQN